MGFCFCSSIEFRSSSLTSSLSSDPSASTMATQRLQTYPQKPRVFILSDISNEPDDAESLCRFLLYANQFETEGLVACTSTWLKNKVCPQDMEKIIDAYAGAVENLNNHVHPDWPYPSAEHLKGLIRKGAEVCPLMRLRSQHHVSSSTDRRPDIWHDSCWARHSALCRRPTSL